MTVTKPLTLAEAEKKHILTVLKLHNGHREQTAAALGIGIRTLLTRLRSYGIKPARCGMAFPRDKLKGVDAALAKL